MLRRATWQNYNDVSEELVAAINITLIMDAVSTSKTSVNFYQTTRRNIAEDSHLHTCRRENLKSHLEFDCSLENP
jgi:mannose/fructose-specific phosphotransferase system component IIA